MLRLLVLPWLVYNAVVACVFAYDKWKAKTGGSRVPERTLLLLALSFGAIGALAGMQLARHKTRKWRFALGIPLMLVLQIALMALAVRR